VAVAVEAVLTGAIHLDALADVADGLGGRSRERALEIMREGTIGAFGAIALVVDLMVKTAAIAALLADGHMVVVAVAGAAALGRAAPLALGWILPYAGAGEGSGRVLTDSASRWSLLGGLVLAIVLAAALLETRAPALLAGAAAAVLVIGATAHRRFGGITGDVLGASVEIATTFALLAAVATR
jgi:cobalamin 5'-phosphate synthase/cobalamin synthase